LCNFGASSRYQASVRTATSEQLGFKCACRHWLLRLHGDLSDNIERDFDIALDTSRGFRLRISGRIARLPGTGAVRCHQPSGAEQRPICLVGVSIDEVAIDNPASGETLATWNIDQEDAPKSTPTSLGR